MRRPAAIVLIALLLALVPSLVFAAEGASVAELCQTAAQGQSSEDMVQGIHDAFEALKAEAKADATRVKEVAPEDLDFGDAEEEEEEEGENPESFPVCSITRDGKTMKYLLSVKGEPDESGYPLYIALHGGGSSPASENDIQWSQMYDYYRRSVDHGIYVACRGMEDVWNMHSLPDAYVMYDRIIEDMVLLKGADPNRVYFLGFSAGGDGVYEVTPRMADRFAAANMSSGHPNQVSLLNVANVPFEIQVGVRDYLSKEAMRSVRGASFETTLSDYRSTYGFGYEHRVLVHLPEGHNFNDNSVDSNPSSLVLSDPATFAVRAVNENWLKAFVDIFTKYFPPAEFLDVSEEEDPEEYAEFFAYQVQRMSYLTEERAIGTLEGAEMEAAKKNFADFCAELTQKITGTGEGQYGLATETVDTDAVHYVNQFTRDYCPSHVIWDLTMRAQGRSVSSFYWLKADKTLDRGLINASFDGATNTFTLALPDEPLGDFSILINPHMVDVTRPVIFETPKGRCSITVSADPKVIEASLREMCDPYLAWVQEISYEQLKPMESEEKPDEDKSASGGEQGTSGEQGTGGSEGGTANGGTQVASAGRKDAGSSKTLPRTGDAAGMPVAALAAAGALALVAARYLGRRLRDR